MKFNETYISIQVCFVLYSFYTTTWLATTVLCFTLLFFEDAFQFSKAGKLFLCQKKTVASSNPLFSTFEIFLIFCSKQPLNYGVKTFLRNIVILPHVLWMSLNFEWFKFFFKPNFCNFWWKNLTNSFPFYDEFFIIWWKKIL